MLRQYKSQTIYRVKPRPKQLPFVSNPDFDLAKSIFQFTVRDLDYQPVKLDKYLGNVCILVNVASDTPGFTQHNIKILNKLHDKYFDAGLRILAFPCNQFNDQESGSNAEIKEFMEDRGVHFDVFDKIDVNGENAHPLWKYLKASISTTSRYGKVLSVIMDPFTKFIAGKSGVPHSRLPPGASEEDILIALDTLLGGVKVRRASVIKVELPPPLEPDIRPCRDPWHFESGILDLV